MYLFTAKLHTEIIYWSFRVCQLWLAIFKDLFKVAKISKACQERWKVGRVYYLITVFKDLCLLYLTKRLVIFCLHSSLSISVFLLPMLCQLFHFAGSFVSKVYIAQCTVFNFGKNSAIIKSNILFFLISGKNPLNTNTFNIKKWSSEIIDLEKGKKNTKNIFKKS